MNKQDELRIGKSNDLTDKLYFMLIGEIIFVDDNNHYIRVPGGWIYRTHYYPDNGMIMSTTFIPYSEAECPEHIKQMADMFGDPSVKVPALEVESDSQGTDDTL